MRFDRGRDQDAAARAVASDVLEVLRDWGVRHVFICPGTTEAAFLDASLGQRDVEIVLATHESVAVAMADGYSRATGEPSVAYLHTNVGLGNGLSHLAAARLARSPVTVLNGLKPAVIQAHGGFTTAPHTRDLVRQYVKHDWQSLTADTVAEDVTRALRIATTEPTGPTWVGLGQDLMEAPGGGTPTAARFRVAAATRPDPGAVAEAGALLAAAQRPVLVAGSEVARHGAWPLLVELAELIGAPVVNEDRRTLERTGFPTDHPQFAGTYDVTGPAVADCDVAFFVGARCFVEFEPPGRPNVPSGARVIHSHVDPQEIGRIYGIDVALVGDERLVVADVLEHLR
ncbi:MAG TPA: thiamine pyrophosphate-binding protein, partial [Mycobacteriales bacterium]